MERVCFLLRLRPERLDEYKRRHQAVWPEMLDALRRAGWCNYSLFLHPDGLLIGYFETPDLARARAAMDSEDVNARWQREMSPFFVPLSSPPDHAFLRLEEIFHLDGAALPSP